jgi:hypothetical protein
MKTELRKTETRKVLLFALFVVLVFAMLSLDRRAEAGLSERDVTAVPGALTEQKAPAALLARN